MTGKLYYYSLTRHHNKPYPLLLCYLIIITITTIRNQMGGHSNTVFVVRASEDVHDYVHDYVHGHVSEDVDVSATTTSLETIKSKPASTSTSASTSISISTFSVRLHLIRHGETEANRNNLVLGQTDSVSK